MSSYYAIAKGRVPGVYTSWGDAKKQVDGFKFPKYRKFATKEEAENFVKENSSPITMKSQTHVEEKAEIITEGLVVFTDGSAINNGKKGAKAGYAMVWPNHPHLTAGKPLEGHVKTNNRAEFMACIAALEAAAQEDPEFRETLYIYTDSELLINTVTKWMRGWKKNGWKKASGDPVMNQDLVVRLDELTNRRKVVWTHVDAHTGGTDWMSTWNDRADVLAKSAVA